MLVRYCRCYETSEFQLRDSFWVEKVCWLPTELKSGITLLSGQDECFTVYQWARGCPIHQCECCSLFGNICEEPGIGLTLFYTWCDNDNVAKYTSANRPIWQCHFWLQLHVYRTKTCRKQVVPNTPKYSKVLPVLTINNDIGFCNFVVLRTYVKLNAQCQAYCNKYMNNFICCCVA